MGNYGKLLRGKEKGRKTLGRLGDLICYTVAYFCKGLKILGKIG